MGKTRKLNANRTGYALLFMIVAMVVLLAAGAGLLQLGLRGRIRATRNTEQISARCAADAGLTKALYEVNSKLTNGTWNENLLPLQHNEQLQHTRGVFTYKVRTNESGNYSVTSIGVAGGACKIVHGELGLKSIYEYGLFTKGGMDLKAGTIIDQYNAKPEHGSLKLGTNSTETNAIAFFPSITVDGDVVVGPGGDPETVIMQKSESAIAGNTYAMSEENNLPDISVPSSLAAAASNGSVTGSVTISSSGKYDSIDLAGTDVITIDGDVTLYVTGPVRLHNSAQLNIVATNPNASLTLYLGGDMLTDNAALINNETQDAKNLKIIGTPTCLNIDCKNGGQVYGTIYAPSASVTFYNSMDFNGAIIADEFLQQARGNIHYDASLKDATPTDEGVRFVIKRWSEE